MTVNAIDSGPAAYTGPNVKSVSSSSSGRPPLELVSNPAISHFPRRAQRYLDTDSLQSKGSGGAGAVWFGPLFAALAGLQQLLPQRSHSQQVTPQGNRHFSSRLGKMGTTVMEIGTWFAGYEFLKSAFGWLKASRGQEGVQLA